MPFALALALSILLHAAAIVMPGWSLPGSGAPAALPLEARLVPLPQPAPLVVAKPQPKPRPRPAKKTPPPVAATPVTTVSVPADAPTAEPQPAEVAAEPAPVAENPAPVIAGPAPPPALPEPPWPREGRLRYLVTYGAGGFVIGETIHEWRVDAGHYSISSVFTPKGLATMVGSTRAQSSAGEVTADGLRPAEFRDQRQDHVQETAIFEWSAAPRVVFSGGRGESPLAPGTQDLVSVFYQLAWLMPRHDVDFDVATAGRVGHWTFEWLGDEKLELGVGVLPTLHLRTRADGDTTEVWLAPTRGGLPLKIRYIDRKGDVFEQAADLLELNQ